MDALSLIEERRKYLLLGKEESLYQQGFTSIAGVDEVGCGSLAGSVVAAAVILPQSYWPKGLNDSKKMSEKRREAAYEDICEHAVAYTVASVSCEVIDAINICQATFLAMKQALSELKVLPDYILVDGNPIEDWDGAQEAIVKGDASCRAIAAASVLAKVTRDRMMVSCDKTYPGYGFSKHKGYGTDQHRVAIEQLGACAIHRRSFEPIKSLVQNEVLCVGR